MNTKARSSRRVFIGFFILTLLFASLFVSACSKTPPKNEDNVLSYKVGTLQTDDLLPLWVAEKEGFLDEQKLEVEIMVFQSAQEQIAAMVAGEIDAMMTDMVVATQLSASGTPVEAVTVMQGAPAGILANPNSGVGDISELKGKIVGNSSNTILEYIFDNAIAEAGLQPSEVKVEEIKKLPVRFEMLSSGQVDAAVLPWTFFEIGRGAGQVPLLDHEQVDSLTSTIFVFSGKFLEKEGADTTVEQTLAAWDKAVDAINAEPETYRALLAEKTKLPEQLAATYPIREYPRSAAPSTEQLQSIIDWMTYKDYLKSEINPVDLVYGN